MVVIVNKLRTPNFSNHFNRLISSLNFKRLSFIKNNKEICIYNLQRTAQHVTVRGCFYFPLYRATTFQRLLTLKLRTFFHIDLDPIWKHAKT